MTALQAAGGGLPLALHIPQVVEQAGSLAGFAAVIGLAVLSALYFSQARDLRRLREWAGRAPERAAEGQPGAVVPGRVVGVPQRPVRAPGNGAPAQAAAGNGDPAPAVIATPGAKPGAGAPAAAAAAAAGAGGAVTKRAGQADDPTADDAQAGQGPNEAKPAEAEPAQPDGAKPAPRPGMPAPASAAAAAGAGAASVMGPAAAGAASPPANAPSPGGAPAPANAPSAGGAPAPANAPAGGAPANAPSAPGAPAPADAPGSGASRPANAPSPGGAPASAGAAASAGGAAASAAGGGTPHAGPQPQRPPGSVLPPRTGTLPPVRRLPASNVGGAPAQTGILGTAPEAPKKRNPLYIALAVAGVLILGAAAAIGVPAIVNGTKNSKPPKTSTTAHHTTKRVAATPPDKITVAVLNGTSIPGLAAQIGDRVDADGFKLGTVSNASQSQGQLANSVAMYARGHERDAARVARQLGIRNVRPVDSNSRQIAGNATVVVVVGSDKTQ
jgi:LytR cell envelope-related transcriptional attenuator